MWRQYPYEEVIKPGASLSHALRLYRLAKDPARAAAEQQRVEEALLARKRSMDSLRDLPDFCYKHEHPMRCGRPNKLYSKHDRVTPIVDALSMMNEALRHASGAKDAFGLFADDEPRKRSRRTDGYDEQEAAEQRAVQRAADVRSGKAKKDPAWECEVCKNRDVSSIIDSIDGRCCPCGTMLRGVTNISVESEWRCHSEDERSKNDAKKRADVAQEPKKFVAQREIDGEALSAAERAKERRSEAKQTSVGGRGYTDAQRIVEEERARDQRSASELTAREELKRTRIVEELNKMFKKLKPIDVNVQKEVRRTAYDLWLQAVRHTNACGRASCCELPLVDRSPLIIATSVFSHTVDAILGGETEMPGVAREHVVDLQMRMQRSPEFTNTASLAQMATTKSMISLMQTPGFNACVPCAPLSVPVPPVAIPSKNIRLERCESDACLGRGEASPSPPGDQLPLRNAVGTVFLAHKSTMPASVRDGAMRALRAPGFVASCKSLACLREVSLQAVAFCVLNAVAREQAEAVGPSSFASAGLSTPMDVPIAHKLKLDLAVAEKAIAAIRQYVPSDAASEASTPPEDDLFVV